MGPQCTTVTQDGFGGGRGGRNREAACRRGPRVLTVFGAFVFLVTVAMPVESMSSARGSAFEKQHLWMYLQAPGVWIRVPESQRLAFLLSFLCGRLSQSSAVRDCK